MVHESSHARPLPGHEERHRLRDYIRDHPDTPSERWVSVSSSNLEAVRYDLGESALDVLFLRKPGSRSKRLYRYSRVPFSVYFGLLNAASKGAFHNERIKWSFDFETLD